MAKSLQRWTSWGLIGVIALMPFHAFLSVYLGSLIGHQSLIQAWKEVIIVILGLMTTWLVASSQELRQSLIRPVNLAIAAFVVISLIVSLIHHDNGARSFWYGAKIDLEFLAVFIIAQVASQRWVENWLVKVIIITSSLVALFGLLQATVLPQNFLTHFGYGPGTLLPYQLVDPAVPNSIRVSSTLAGPNQLGSFLILPICLMAYLILKKRWYWLIVPLAVNLYALLHSFSRSAWIGAIVALAVIAFLSLPRRLSLGLGGIMGLGLLLVGLNYQALFRHYPNLQYFALHSQTTGSIFQSSDEGHLGSLRQGVDQASKHWGGQGLGSAGPASFQSSHTLITENYYLQLAIETGLLGLVIFLLINGLLAANLISIRADNLLAVPCLAALAGLAVVNLFLHAWADSSTAFILWGVAGVAIGLDTGKKRHG